MKNAMSKARLVLQRWVVFLGAIVFAVSSQVFAQDAAALKLEEHLQSMQTGMYAMQSELEKLKS